MVAGAILMVCAAAYAFFAGDWKTGTVYVCYGVANAVLATVKG